MADVFVSYSRSDAAFVRRLEDALAKANHDAWVDWQDIPLTAEWLSEIYSGIEAADNFVFVLSPESIASATCQKELAHAEINSKRIIPILHRSVSESAVPTPLARLNWIHFRAEDDFDTTFVAFIAVLDTDLEWKRNHSRLLVRAKEWDRERRDFSFLLRGKDLRDGERWLAMPPMEGSVPTTLHAHYILASRQAETRRQRKQLAAVALALVLTTVLAIVALLQRNTARLQAAIATSRQLAVQSSALVASKPDLALLLAVEAYEANDNFEARSALFTALRQRPNLKAFLRPVGKSPYGAQARRLSALAFSRDGRLIAAVDGLNRNTITVWDTATRQPVTTLEGHSAPVLSLAFAPDGRTLLSGGRDGSLVFWDVSARRALATVSEHGDAITSVAVSADGRTAASGDGMNTVILWDLERRTKIGVIRSPTTRSITHLMFRENDLITVGRRATEPKNDEVTEFWNRQTLQRRGPPINQRILAFSPDLTRFAAVSQSQGVNLFYGVLLNIPALTELTEPTERREEPQEIAVTVFDSESGKSIGAEQIRDDGPVTSAAFDSTGSWFAFGSGSTVHLWNLDTQRVMEPLRSQQDIVDTIAFAPDGQTLAVLSWDDSVSLWSVGGTGALGRELTKEGGGLLAFSPDSRRLVSATAEGVLLWDAESGTVMKRYEPRSADASGYFVGSMGFDSRGSTLFVDVGSSAYLLDLENAASAVSSTIANDASAIAFSPGGQAVAVGLKNGELQVLNASTFQPQITIPTAASRGSVTAVAVSHSGKELAAGYSDGTLVFWDSKSGKRQSQELQAFDSGEAPTTLAFSPDDRLVMVAATQTLALWDPFTYTRINVIANVDGVGAPLIAAFSPDARLLAWSTLALRDVNVADASARQQLGPPLRYSSGFPNTYVDGLAFSPDGRILASAYWRWIASRATWVQSGIVLWTFDIGDWPRQACATANRNLTQEEWGQYLAPAPYTETCSLFPRQPTTSKPLDERVQGMSR